VKGKSEPAAVYELYGLDGKTDHQIQPALQAYTRGLECYRAGEYAESVSHFEEALRFNPKDTVSAVYLERSRALVANPPPADWDGVYVMQHK
jgi:adenylate cyclase